MAKSLLLVVFLFKALCCQAQEADTLASKPPQYRYLLLSNTNTAARFRLYLGETITFSLKGEKGKRSGKLTRLTSNSFFVNDLEVPLQTLEKIELSNHTRRHKAANVGAYLLKGAGSLFTLVGAVNFLTKPDDRVDGLHTIGGALTMYGVGVGLHRLSKRTYSLSSKWQLKIIEMY